MSILNYNCLYLRYIKVSMYVLIFGKSVNDKIIEHLNNR
jgi:hypothetical protein